MLGDNKDLLSRAEQAEESANWFQAANLYTEALKVSPKNLELKEKLGWCLSRAKEYSRAIDIFGELFQLQPDVAKWPYMVGYQYHEQERWQDAIVWYDKSLKLKADYIVVCYRVGYAHFKLGHVGDALKAFERCRKLWYALPEGPSKERDKKNCAKATYHQAEVLIENPQKVEGAFSAAVDLLRKALELDPSNHNIHYLMGKALLGNGNPEGAVNEFSEADKLQPNQDYILDRWGQALIALKKFEEAEDVYERIPAHQRKSYILRNLGELQMKRGNVQQAVTTLKLSIQKEGRNHYAHYQLGLCHKTLSDFTLAVHELREALRLRQKNYGVPFPEAQKVLDEILREHPEAASAKVNSHQQGKISKYNSDRGFGYIQYSGGSIFFHVKDFPRNMQVDVGTPVEFDEGQSEKGSRAINIKIIPVKRN
jgi:tetratricopeptide (TPR) repeat protein